MFGEGDVCFISVVTVSDLLPASGHLASMLPRAAVSFQGLSATPLSMPRASETPSTQMLPHLYVLSRPLCSHPNTCPLSLPQTHLGASAASQTYQARIKHSIILTPHRMFPSPSHSPEIQHLSPIGVRFLPFFLQYLFPVFLLVLPQPHGQCGCPSNGQLLPSFLGAFSW